VTGVAVTRVETARAVQRQPLVAGVTAVVGHDLPGSGTRATVRHEVEERVIGVDVPVETILEADAMRQ
jgi:hypothetical protein